MNSSKKNLINDIMLDVAAIKHYALELDSRIEDENTLIVRELLGTTFTLDDRLKILFTNRKTKDINTSKLKTLYDQYVRSFQRDMELYKNLNTDFKNNQYPRSIYKTEKFRIKNNIKTKSEILKTLKKEVKTSQKEFEVNNQQ